LELNGEPAEMERTKNNPPHQRTVTLGRCGLCSRAGLRRGWQAMSATARLARLVFETLDTILNIRYNILYFCKIILVHVFGQLI
jgi:hypothetical protein